MVLLLLALLSHHSLQQRLEAAQRRLEAAKP
jgi:hypothetical protein